MEVPLRPCALNSSLAASSRRERILWRGVGDPAGCAREALRERAPGMPLPSSLTLAKRALRFPTDLVCIAYKQDRSKRFFRGVPALIRDAGVLALFLASRVCH